MGRRAQSPELKEARGNPGKRPIKKISTVVAHIKLQRPSWLTDALAKKVWDQLLGSLHFLRESDGNVFGRYCVYLADWVTATKEIKASGGSVYTTSSQHVQDMLRINPWFTVRSRLEDDLVKLEEKLGLTPLDRQKIIANLAHAAQMPTGDLWGAGDGVVDGGAQPATGATAASPDIDTVGGLRRLDG